MRTIGLLGIAVLFVAAAPLAQGQEPFQPVGNMSQIMVSMIYPPTNDILLSIYRGAPKDDKEWAALERSAVLLAESGNVLMMRGHAVDQGQWMKHARMMVDAGAAAYKAARAKDVNGLTAVAEPLNASCIACHKAYRRNVHPAQP
jgi:hypothetical protein